MNSPAKDLQSMLCIQPIRPQSTIGNIENNVMQALAASNSTTPSSELAAFLRYVDEHEHTISQDLAAGIDQLQELFLGVVHQAFHLAGITVDSRMIISLNQRGELHIEAACADQKKIEELLSSSKVLPALLKLLSVQSAMLDGISNLCLLTGVRGDEESERLSRLQQSYRVCLKGQLSHFYRLNSCLST